MTNSPIPQDHRHWYLDILRIIATFTVILIHVSPLAHLEVGVASAQWHIMNFISSVCSWNVSAFFMISGALFLSPKKELSTRRLYTKTLARMLASFLFWSAIYAAAHCLLNGKGKWTFINQLVRGHYHQWYVFAIIALYWITPLLRRITASRQATEYLLLTGFLFSFAASYAMTFVQMLPTAHGDVVQSLQSAYGQVNPYRGLSSIFYFVLGHYLHEYPLSKRMRNGILVCGAIALIATPLLSVWHSVKLGATSSAFTSNGSLNVLALTAGVFVLCKEGLAGYRPEGHARRVIAHLAKCSYGVYLAHAFVLERLSPAYGATPLTLLASILLTTVLVYVISYGISAVLNRIPVLNKYVV